MVLSCEDRFHNTSTVEPVLKNHPIDQVGQVVPRGMSLDFTVQ